MKGEKYLLKFKIRKKGKIDRKQFVVHHRLILRMLSVQATFKTLVASANCTVHVDIPYTHRRRIELEDKAKVVA